MRTYEILFIVSPNTEETDVESTVKQFSDVVANQGATVTKVDRMGRRQLAYPIGKYREGHYIVLTVEGTGSEIAEIERRLRVSDAIIRYMSTRIDEDLKRAEKLRTRREARVRTSRRPSSGGRSYNAGLPISTDESESEAEEDEE